ncbi:MAG: hypothetical protein HY655_03025 [Acidobacteria bacterium]|nr:hypothetical protein [Acidobacteriota bacterium]
MQRQLRLGDILDDYCPRERRVTNHAIVAMMGPDVKQTRCTTCDAEHEYKQAKVPRQRRKTETPAALYATVLAGGPKRHEPEHTKDSSTQADALEGTNGSESAVSEADVLNDSPPADDTVTAGADATDAEEAGDRAVEEEGPVHRPLIRASLPRPEGTPPPQRPAPDFTIRQPGGRPPNRFRPRHQRGGQTFQGQGNRGNGNLAGGPSRGGMRHGGGRPQGPASSRLARRNGPGRKRSK